MRRLAIAIVLALVGLLAVASLSPAANQSRLTYAKAKRAIQAKADRFAGTSTEITAMYRRGALSWSGRGEWKRVNPTGCTGCDYDPITGEFVNTPSTESCSVEVLAKLAPSGKTQVSTENFSCY